MANLYDSASRARKFVLAFFVFAVLLMGYNFISGLQSARENTPINTTIRYYMNVDRSLGDIPKPEITGITYNSNANFSFQGFFPSFPDISYVYSVEEPQSGFFRFERGQEVADILGFDREAYESSDNTNYTWSDFGNTRELDYNTTKKSWNLTTDYSRNASALSNKTLLNLNQYISQVKSVMSQLGFDGVGLLDGEATARYASIGVDNIFIDQINADDAEYAFVDVFKIVPQADLKPRNELPQATQGSVIPEAYFGKVYSEDPRYGQASFIFSNSVRNLGTDIFELKHTEFVYNESEKGAYYIITPQEAWDAVQRGEGFLTFLRVQGQNYFSPKASDVNVSQFTANADETELGYFEPGEWDGFIYPIYVFRGTAQMADGKQASFVFYVDAIKRLT